MILTKEQLTIIERELLKELPIRVNSDSIEYNDYFIVQDKDHFWCLYNKINGLDLIKRFYLKSCAVMAARSHERCKMQDFNTVVTLDTSYCSLSNDIVTFKYMRKKTQDPVKKDNFDFRSDEAKLKLKEVKRRIENLYRTVFR